MRAHAEPFESAAFERQISPVLMSVLRVSSVVLAIAVAITFKHWVPLALAGTIGLVFAFAPVKWRRKGALRVDAKGVWWRGSLVVPHGGIVSVEREDDAIAIRTDSSWRSVQRFYVGHRHDADALISALGSADERPAAPIRVGSPLAAYGQVAYFACVGASSLWLLTALLLRSVRHAPFDAAHIAAAATLSALAFVPTRLTLGAEGLEIRWLWRVRWIRWIDVASVERLRFSDALRLRLTNEKTVRFSTEAAFALSEADAADALLRRIENAIREARERRPHAVAATLARGGATTAEWVSHLRGLISRGPTGYRELTLSADEVQGLLLDHAASPTLRVAAAVAYAPTRGRELVREVAESVASTRVRVALEAAADGDDATLERALDAVEEEQHRG